MVLPRRLIAACVVLAVVGLLTVTVERLWLVPFHVPSASMRPALHPGDRVLVDRRISFSHIRRGDIVVFAAAGSDETLRTAGRTRSPADQDRAFPRAGAPHSRLLVKRVVGLPGEDLEAHQGFVAVNQTHRLEQPWLGNVADLDISPVHLRSDELFVLGDNHAHSVDSRVFGPLPRRSVVGIVRWRIWPWDRTGKVT